MNPTRLPIFNFMLPSVDTCRESYYKGSSHWEHTKDLDTRLVIFQIQKDDSNGRLAWIWKKREIRSPSFGEMDDAYP